MRLTWSFLPGALFLAAAALAGTAPTPEPAPTDVRSGVFRMDPAHTRVMFGVSHLGFAEYTAFFRRCAATLDFDPEVPAKMKLEATVDPSSVETLYPDASLDFNAVIAGADFLNAKAFPEIRFVSTSVRLTAPDAAAVTGDLTLHGVTRPVTLRVRFNGGYAGHPLDPGGARIGFSATGTVFRSDFGIVLGIPEPGTTIGVGDAVSIRIETEFVNPDASGPQLGP